MHELLFVPKKILSSNYYTRYHGFQYKIAFCNMGLPLF